MEFKYDTQLLIDGENLDEDEIAVFLRRILKVTACLQCGMKHLLKFTFTPMSRGRCWNTVLQSAGFTTLLWRTWTDSHGGLKG